MEVENLKTHVKVSGSRSASVTADSSTLDDLRREIEAIRRDASEAKRTANRTADKLRRPTGVDVEGTLGTVSGFEHSSIITRLTEDVAALKAASQGTLDIGQLTHDVRCLKYECRRLKDQATVGGAGFMMVPDGSGLDELRRDMQDLQRRVKDLERNVPSPHTVAESLMSGRESRPIVSGDFPQEIERRREEAERTDPLLTEIVQDITVLQGDVADIRARGAATGGEDSAALLRRLEQQVKSIQVVLSESSFQKVQHDVRCLKAEVKRLLAVTPGEARTEGVDNLIRVISDEVLVVVRQDVGKQLRCVKHELRKIKVGTAGAGAELAPVDMDVGVAEASSAVIEELRRDIEDLRMQISLAGSGGGIAQVFVDLPQTAAVQLVFRAQHEGDDAA